MSNPSFVGPVSGALICAYYHIAAKDWAEWDPTARGLFRMAYAADVLKVQEHPRGTNTGPEVDRILRSVGLDPGNAWCASNWGCYLIDSGVPREALPELAGLVHGLDGSCADWAKKEGRIAKAPERGMAGLIFHTERTGHLVTIPGVLDDGRHLRTIEGNSNDEGSREGYEICRRVRLISEIDMFIDCTGLAA